MKLNLGGRKIGVIFLLIPIMAMSMVSLNNNTPQANVLDLSAVSSSITLKIGDIKGTSDSSHAREEHPLMSVAFAGFRDVTPASSGSSQDRSASRPTLTEIAVLKTVDAASPQIFEEMAKGTNFRDVSISFWTSDITPVEYIKLELQDVIISSYVFSGSEGEEPPLESFTLNFSKITYIYSEVNTDGSKGDSVTGGWDVVRNETP
ncbi:MAG: Hcp family type VI secretion system effector [Candidatus Kariarchaeaceae archaeon]